MSSGSDPCNRSDEETVGAAVRRAARKYGGKLALSYEDREWSFADLDRAATSVAAALLASGLEKGDRLSAYAGNSDAYFIGWLGCARAGLVHVPANYNLTKSEVEYILRQSGAKAVLCDGIHAKTIAELEEIRIQAIGLASQDVTPDILTLANVTATAVPVRVEGGDLAQIQYTSGTTSAPKGAMMTHRAILFEYASCIHDLSYGQDDRCLAALPLYHTAQMHAFTMPQMLAGASTWLIDSPQPEQVFSLIEKHRITSFFAPPTVWISLLRHPDFDRHDLSSLEKIYYGASIMPAPVLKELGERLPRAGLYNVYGQSEIGPVATVLLPHEHAERPTSAGRPVLNVETRVVDPEMRDVPCGEQGEIVHRSPQLLTGYWNLPEETEQAFRGSWFHSGDAAYRDEAGYIYVVDRIKDVINTGGVLVACREVEDALFSHPSISEVAVIGLPDEKWIEAVTAVVVFREDQSAEPEELTRHAEPMLASFKLPKRYFFVEELPRNASGKILKRELRDRFGSPH
jgi:fatty-acyl-CoA synthase